MKNKLMKKIRWWHICLALIFVVLSIAQILTNEFNEKYVYKVAYDPSVGFRRELYNDCYVLAAGLGLYEHGSTRLTAYKKDIYFDERNKDVKISVAIYYDFFRIKYIMISYDSWDEVRQTEIRSFGGYAFVDGNMQILDIPANDNINRKHAEEVLTVLSDDFKDLFEAVDHYWGIKLTCPY